MSLTRQMFHWPVLLIGIALIAAPLALGMPGKAAGQRMLNDFHPVMQPATVTAAAGYFNTFQALRPVAIGGQQAASESPQLLSALGAGLHMSPAQVDGFLVAKFPAMAGLIVPPAVVAASGALQRHWLSGQVPPIAMSTMIEYPWSTASVQAAAPTVDSLTLKNSRSSRYQRICSAPGSRRSMMTL